MDDDWGYPHDYGKPQIRKHEIFFGAKNPDIFCLIQEYWVGGWWNGGRWSCTVKNVFFFVWIANKLMPQSQELRSSYWPVKCHGRVVLFIRGIFFIALTLTFWPSGLIFEMKYGYLYFFRSMGNSGAQPGVPSTWELSRGHGSHGSRSVFDIGGHQFIKIQGFTVYIHEAHKPGIKILKTRYINQVYTYFPS